MTNKQRLFKQLNNSDVYPPTERNLQHYRIIEKLQSDPSVPAPDSTINTVIINPYRNNPAMTELMDGIRRYWHSIKNRLKIHTLEDFNVYSEAAPGGFITRYDCLIAPGAAGIHDRYGQPILASYLMRELPGLPKFPYGEPVTIDPSMHGGDDELETVITIPILNFRHFGLMLCETAGWLAELMDPESELFRQAGPDFTLIVCGHGRNVEASIESIRKALGLPADRVLSTKRMNAGIKCRKALIPQSTNYHLRPLNTNNRHFAAVRQLVWRYYDLDPETVRKRLLESENRHEASNKKVYMSRSKLPTNLRKLTGEEGIEKSLESKGWRIVHPETLPILEQLSVLKEASVIAGNTSSAFHLLMYFGLEAKGKTVIGMGMEQDIGRTGEDSWLYEFVKQFRAQGIHFWHLACLERDYSNTDEKLFKLDRYKDLKPKFPISRIVREMERIADQAQVATP